MKGAWDVAAFLGMGLWLWSLILYLLVQAIVGFAAFELSLRL